MRICRFDDKRIIKRVFLILHRQGFTAVTKTINQLVKLFSFDEKVTL